MAQDSHPYAHARLTPGMGVGGRGGGMCVGELTPSIGPVWQEVIIPGGLT